ncbi:unnamed protein product [Urochloa humidicola]
MMREQLHQILRAPVGRPRLGRRCGFPGHAAGSPPAGLHGRRGGRRRDDGAAVRRTPSAGNETSNIAAYLGPPVFPDSCTAPGRIPVSSPHYCAGHGLTARVRLLETGRLTSPVASPRYSPEYTPASPTPAVEPRLPEHLLKGTIAARRGAPPLYIDIGESSGDDVLLSPLPAPEVTPLPPPQAAALAALELAPPPPSPVMAAPPGFEAELAPPPPPPRAAWFPGRPTAAAAANRRPGLRRPRFIPTGHIPAGPSAGEARRPLPSGEGEA